MLHVKDRPLRSSIVAGLVFTFTVFVLFYNLGGHSFEEWDESVYAWAAKAALQDGEYFLLKFQYGTIWDKTPFAVYPIMLMFKLFGASEVSARVSSALFGLGIMIEVFLVARRFYGQTAGALAVLVAITIPQFVFSHGLRSADLDSMTVFFITGAMTSWLLVERVWLKVVLTAACLGFTVLCKGPLVGIPVVAIISSLLLHNPLKGKSIKSFALGAAVFCLVVLPWHLYMFTRFGDEFLQNHVVRVYFQWFAVGAQDYHVQHDMFLIKGVLLSPHTFPWYGAALLSIVYAFKLRSQEKRLVEFLLIAWVVTAYLVVNASKTKIIWYVFPVYPPLAIMIAKSLTDFIDDPNYLNKSVYYGGLMVILAFFFDRQVFPHNTTSNAAWAGMATLGLFGIVTVLGKVLRERGKAIAVLLICGILYVPVKTTVKHALSKSEHPILPIARTLERGKPVYAFALAHPAASYYLAERGPFQELGGLDQLRHVKGNLVVTKGEYLERIKEQDRDGSYRLSVDGELYTITAIMRSDKFVLVRVE